MPPTTSAPSTLLQVRSTLPGIRLARAGCSPSSRETASRSWRLRSRGWCCSAVSLWTAHATSGGILSRPPRSASNRPRKIGARSASRSCQETTRSSSRCLSRKSVVGCGGVGGGPMEFGWLRVGVVDFLGQVTLGLNHHGAEPVPALAALVALALVLAAGTTLWRRRKRRVARTEAASVRDEAARLKDRLRQRLS